MIRAYHRLVSMGSIYFILIRYLRWQALTRSFARFLLASSEEDHFDAFKKDDDIQGDRTIF